MSEPSHNKIGLVLSGGGAKGAYQVGVVEYLAELGFVPDIISGTSIGALNGAILASSNSMENGAANLVNAWEFLGEAEVLKYNYPAIAKNAIKVAKPILPDFSNWLTTLLTNSSYIENDTVFDPTPLDSLIRRFVNPNKLIAGTELWITAFPSLNLKGLPFDILDTLINVARVHTGTPSEWFRVQDFRDPDLLFNVLLASAAIPIAFPRRDINGRKYIDGGIQDNTPLKALSTQGCTHAIVVHLSNGNVWNRHEFPDIQIIEVRPSQSIQKSDKFLIGGINSILDFSTQTIQDLRQRGFNDARITLEPIIRVFNSLKTQRNNSSIIIQSMKRLLDDPPL